MLLGIHVGKTNDILKNKSHSDISDAIERDTTELGINAAQIFTHGPQGMNPNKIDYKSTTEKTKDIDLTVHSAYPSVGIWKVNKENKGESKSKRLLDAVTSQLITCKKINAWGWVLHIAKTYPDIASATMKVLKPLAIKTGVKIILEMVASKADPDKTYETPEKIDNLTTLIGPEENWWGWCVDTAHLWGAGVDVRSYKSMHDWLYRLTYKKKILMFHLNGSSAVLGSGKDKHEIAFSPDDVIWHGVDPDKSGVKAIVEFANERGIPMICEINRGDKKNCLMSMATIKKLGGVV
jgi:deoxyribonuclease-4